MKLETKKPPKDRDFLGLVERPSYTYWEIFFWATKKDGVDKAQYVDRGLFKMPKIKGWVDFPKDDELE